MARITKSQREIERLLWRAGFGPRPHEAANLARRGRRATVEDLLRPRGRQVGGRPPRVEGAPLDPVNRWGHDALWWLDRAVRTRQPLAERMTLNWHDHWATSNQKVGDTKLMMQYYWALRTHSLGRFRTLAHAMLDNHAMQVWLDLTGSEKSAPNENFARELLELFTLGVNNGYTEKDIREAARAFTGFTRDWPSKKFGFDTARHDDGMKTVLGKRGRWKPHDIIDIAIDDPHHAPFLVTKLWGYFTPRPPSRRFVREMARTYRAARTDVRPVLRMILNHPAIYADLSSPDFVKPPVVFVAGMLRSLNRTVTDGSWSWMMGQMGQVPFYPPNVAGWPSNAEWMSAASARARFQAGSHVIEGWVKEGSVSAKQSPKAALAAARKACGDPVLTPLTSAVLARYAVRSVAGRTDDWEIKHYFPERQRVLRHLILAGPDAQVC
ncbi:MAG: DUF1800 domain-containing protein [Thermoleophilia bacterium]|nr:DUF1800 domain-containing protein [Thermoleophilia bacterium]